LHPQSFAGILKGGNLREDMKKMKDEEKALDEKKLHLKPLKK